MMLKMPKAFEHEYLAAGEDMFVDARWHSGAKLTFFATSRIVEILTGTDFGSFCAGDIQCPEGVSEFQIIPERTDEILKDSLIVVAPSKDNENYFIRAQNDDGEQATLCIPPNLPLSQYQRPADTRFLVNHEYVAIIASIGFAYSSDELGLIRHQVLNRDKEKYERARKINDLAQMRVIEARAIRNHKNERLIDTF